MYPPNELVHNIKLLTKNPLKYYILMLNNNIRKSIRKVSNLFNIAKIYCMRVILKGVGSF